MSNHSKEFFELIRGIGEAKSKQEEDKIILREMATLKTGMENPKVTLKMMKEYMVRLLYCEMLGHDASFGYINAIKLTSSKDMLEKRVGYLAVTLCLPPEHELLLLLIANLQNDMKSTNYISACCALTAAAKVVNEETIPALLPQVLELRKHAKPIVRKKAISTLHRFYQISPSSVPDIIEYAKEALCDPDPCVMGASLCLLYDLLCVPDNVRQLKDLVPGFVTILKQIIERRLSRDYDYHRLPAPWIQIKLLKNIALLCADDRSTSELVYEVLREGMQRADTGLNIGHAVVFEFVKTITTIYPNNLLLESAASAISRFVTSSNHNLKYLGIQALTQIVKINPKYAIQHQMVVIDCLEDTDETLRRRTLELLFTMTNSNNVVVIVKRLLEFARKSIDTHMRKELIEKISILAKNYSPNISWYLDTMNTLFEIDPQYIPQEALQNMMSVIGEGVGIDEDDEEMRSHCVETFCDVIDSKNVIHDLHIQVIAWVLGEYSYMNANYDSSDILSKLCDLVDRQLEFEETRCWIITAMTKIVAQCKVASPEVLEYVRKYKDSKNVDLQQRCYEFLALVNACERNSWEEIMDSVLPLDGAYEDIEVDIDLSFAQDYVNIMIRKGSRKYLNNEEKKVLLTENAKPVKRTGLMVNAYPTVKATPNPVSTSGIVSTAPIDIASRAFSATNNTTDISTSLPKKQGKGRWVEESEIEEEPVKVSIPPTTVTDTVSKSTPVVTSPSSESHHNEVHKPPVTISTAEAKRKQKYQDLFVTDSGSTATTKVSTQPKKTAPKRKTSKGPTAKPILQPTTVESTPVQQSQPISVDDIFSDMVMTNPVPQVVHTATQPKSTMNELDDFFSMTTTAPSVATVSTPQTTQDSFFDQILQPSKPSSVALQPVPMSKSNDIIIPQSKNKRTSYMIQQLASSHKSAFSDLVQLVRDDRVLVEYNKFWKSDSLIVALVLSTDRGFVLPQISCQFSPPSAFAMTIQSDVESKQKPNGLTFNSLDTTRPIYVAITLTPTDIVMGTRLVGQVAYSNEQNFASYLNVNIPIDTIDIITEYPDFGSTSQFAEGWRKYTQEKKNLIKLTGPFDINRCIDTLKQKAKISIIQIIDMEVIGVCRVVGRSDVILIHSKFNATANSGTITVRTADRTLTENVSRLVSSIF
nr:unnamed protein product [Naegleria fowleri]